ncbi:hypothetical protein DEH81_05565 [Pectobacterium zantedeschiae]|nr:hypothetical protein DEH81_05565 [Pectobacterium zantedeschiae]
MFSGEERDVLISVIIVSYNSFNYLEWNIPVLDRMSFINEIIIVDNGSLIDLEKIKNLSNRYKKVKVNCGENVGFSQANNLGVELSSSLSEYVLFLNPDAIIDEFNLGLLTERLDGNPELVAISAVLKSFDFENKKELVHYDSLGIYKSGFSWKDIVHPNDIRIFDELSYPDALCGALILVRKSIVNNLIIKDGYFFNPRFFMYKEDIELSIRLREIGRIAVDHSTLAFHCRGWSSRKKMSRMSRLQSAKNEVIINFRYDITSLPYSIFKLSYVFFIEDNLFFLLRLFRS